MSANQTENNRTVVQVYEKEIRDDHFERNVEEAERHAHQFRREAKELFDYARLLKQRAEEAQLEAAEMATQANLIAQEALIKHLEGQEKLALAAQKMLEAGSLLQKEASSVTLVEVPYNRHELMNIHQGIGVEGAEIRDLKQEVKVVRETEVIGEGGFREAEEHGDRHFRHEGHEDHLDSEEGHFRGEDREYAGGEHRFRSGEGYGSREEQLFWKNKERGAAAGEAETYRQHQQMKIR
ncbi:hypothetical protein AAVH_35392 [Aphelenchoides avenae]|nr:hypothetical protein AAVH_35392 [Aphelenchus avenae]